MLDDRESLVGGGGRAPGTAAERFAAVHHHDIVRFVSGVRVHALRAGQRVGEY